MKTLFLATELYEPVGGLHRYTTNLLSAWSEKLEKGETDIEPIVFSVKPPDKPLKDLAQSHRFKEFIDNNKGINVYEAERGGEECYFIEGEVPDLEKFHWELWNRYGIDSSRTSRYMEWYNDTLSVFWYWVPRLARFLREKEDVEFKCVDAQDWLAFPAGFLVRDRLGIPLVTRFHSGEFGRSLGSPRMEDAPIQIEKAALSFSDYIQGVSISESTFQITKLLPLKKDLDEELKERKSEEWYEYQKEKDEKIRKFLLYESEKELVLLKEMVGGMPNGIYLEDWEEIDREDIEEARERLKKGVSDKERFIFFIGRTDYRKGLDFLLDAFSSYREQNNKTGLVIASSMNEEEYQKYREKIQDMGIEEDVLILDKWLEPHEKKSLMCAADVVALPSIYEPFGIVALEGLAADYASERNGMVGPVVIAGNTGGMAEIIRSGINGFEVPIHDFQIDSGFLREAIEEALKTDAREKISKEGSQRVQSNYFRWSFILDRILEVYDKAEKNWEYRKQFFS